MKQQIVSSLWWKNCCIFYGSGAMAWRKQQVQRQNILKRKQRRRNQEEQSWFGFFTLLTAKHWSMMPNLKGIMSHYPTSWAIFNHHDHIRCAHLAIISDYHYPRLIHQDYTDHNKPSFTQLVTDIWGCYKLVIWLSIQKNDHCIITIIFHCNNHYDTTITILITIMITIIFHCQPLVLKTPTLGSMLSHEVNISIISSRTVTNWPSVSAVNRNKPSWTTISHTNIISTHWKACRKSINH